MSRPRKSVPRGWAREGPCSASRNCWTTGADAASRAKPASTARPSSAARWRRKRRHVSNPARAGAARGVGTAASVVAYAGVDIGVQYVNCQVDQDEQRREGEHDPLDERIVAGEDRVDQELPDPRPAEHCLSEYRAA